MKKLSKKQETENTMQVNIHGEIYSIANVKESGIVLKNTLLIGKNDLWQEVACSDLNIQNNPEELKELILSEGVNLKQIGIHTEKKEIIDFQPKHEDYMKLEIEFPEYPYFLISLLYKHITRYGRKSNLHELKLFLRRVSESGKTIHDWIKDSENENTSFVAGVNSNEPIETVISDIGVSLKYSIAKENNLYTGVVTIENEIQGSAPKETIKQAENECLQIALVLLKKLITQSNSPDIYYKLFTKVQNKFKITNMSEKTKLRESQLAKMGLAYSPKDDSFSGYGFTVSGNSIENDSDEDWQNLIDRIDSSTSYDTEPAEPAEPVAPALVAELNRTDERMKQALGLGFKYVEQENELSLFVTGKGSMSIPLLDIHSSSDRKWTGLMIEAENLLSKSEAPLRTPPAPEPETAETKTSAPETETVASETETVTAQPSGRGMSITTIEGMDAAKISEFKNLEKETDKLIKANPIIQVTDKASLEKAKKNRAAMLKSCTAIDGKDGLTAQTKKALNTAKALFEKFLSGVSEKRREHYNKQNDIIQEYENAEAIRIAAEELERANKIKTRTDRLFAVPMMFNSTLYSIGNMYVTPSQIESATDEEFDALVAQAEAVKVRLDAEELANKAKDDQIAELKAQLAKLTGVPVETAESAPVPSPVENTEPAAVTPASPVATTNTSAPEPLPITETKTNSMLYHYNTEFVKADEDNDILIKLDMENLNAISMSPIPPAYIKCRAFYDRGAKEVAKAVSYILYDETPNALKKSERIAELCKIILNQK